MKLQVAPYRDRVKAYLRVKARKRIRRLGFNGPSLRQMDLKELEELLAIIKTKQTQFN